MGEVEVKYIQYLSDRSNSSTMEEVETITYDSFRDLILIGFDDGGTLALKMSHVAYIQSSTEVEIIRTTDLDGGLIYGKL